MLPLFLRVIDAPDRAEYDRHWIELAPAPFVVDRAVVRSEDVSRRGERCVLLRPDHDESCWEMRNRAPNRLLIAYSGRQRYELRCDMSVLLRGTRWSATLTDAYSVELSARRPAGIVVPPTVSDDAGRAGTTGPTRGRRDRDLRAAEFLDRHRLKRLVLAHQWRQHIGHTLDVAEDLTTAEVGRDFGIPDKDVNEYRIALARYVFQATGHQQAVRDLVVQGGLLTWDDVAEADREVARIRARLA